MCGWEGREVVWLVSGSGPGVGSAGRDVWEGMEVVWLVSGTGPGVGRAAAPQAPWITPRLLRMAVANTHTNTCASPSRREGEVQWSPRESAWKPAPRLSALPAPPNARPASARLPRAGALELISMSLVSPRAARGEAPPRGEGTSCRGLRCAPAPRHPPGSTRWS
jgi:hypothetical protein